MRADSAVVVPPSFDQYLGFAQRVEHFEVEQFIAEPGIEAVAVAFFPRRCVILPELARCLHST
jgi:hypothetical protein